MTRKRIDGKGPFADTKDLAKRRGIERWEREEALRSAEVGYITDDRQRPLDYWWEVTCAELIAWNTFEKRAGQGKWSTRRDRYWRGVQQKAIKKIELAAATDRYRELKQIQQIREEALEAIQPKVINGRKIYPVAPNSLEGMINALVKLDQLTDAKRDSIMALIEPKLMKDDDGDRPTVFSPEEYRHAATVLLERRREQQQRLLTGETTNDSKELESGTNSDGEADPV